MMFACGASAPDCSTSRAVSPDPAFALTGPDPPSMLSSLIRLAFVVILRTLDQKYVASDGWTLAYVMMPSVSPWPLKPFLYSIVRPYWLAKLAGALLPSWRPCDADFWFASGVCTALLL